MPFKRLMTSVGTALQEAVRQGAGLLTNVSPVVVTADANATLTVEQIAGGHVLYTGITAGRTITPPTAALLLAAYPDMDIGDTYSFLVSAVPAFALTWQVATGVTLAGRATTPASSWSIVHLQRTAAAAFVLTVA